MSSIPYNYGKYIDDKVSMTNQGHVGASKQIQSPASAGSRGLAKTTQFTNDRTQMQMGNSPIAESMVEIRSILDRIDGVNAPVQEDDNSDYIKQAYMLTVKHHTDGSGDGNINEDIGDLIEDYNEKADKKISPEQIMRISKKYNAGGDYVEVLSAEGIDGKLWLEVAKKKYSQLESADSGELSRLKELSGIEEGHYPHIKSFDKLYGINDMQQYKAMADDAQSMDMGEFMDTYSSVIDMAGDFWEDHQKTSESNEDVVNEDPNTLAKELASEIMRYVRKGFDHIPADALKAKAKEYLSSIKESAVQEAPKQSDIDYTKLMLDISVMKDRIAELPIDDDAKTSALTALGQVEDDLSMDEHEYTPFPEADEFNIEEDEDFEEVLGPLGFPEDETELFDAEYRGRKVPLNKPMRGDVKKFKVYVKDPKTGNVKKVNFGHGGTSAKRKTMRIRKSNPKARKSFRARHNCANPGPKTKARYWSCRKW